MKKLLLMTVCLLMAVATQAQEPNTLTVHLKDGTTVPYNVEDIDYLTFDTDGTPQEGELPSILDGKVYALSLPTLTVGVDDPVVYQIMANGQQVAEVCLEYVRQEGVVDEQMLVAYPIGDDGKANLTKGYTLKDGGSLVWNLSTNTCTYTAGSGSGVPASLYLDDGNFTTSTTESNVISTTAQQYMLKDVRGLEEEEYSIVKIGTQYWMGENLRATKLNDGTNITMYKATQGDQWNSTNSPAYHIFGDGEISDIMTEWGCMYNGYTIASGKAAPSGWNVTTMDDWQTLKTYLAKSQSAKVKSKFDWNDTPGNGNNLSGLNVKPGGIFSYTSMTDDEYQFARAFYWTSTTYDGNKFGAVAIFNSISIYNTDGDPLFQNTYERGYYIRCIRK